MATKSVLAEDAFALMLRHLARAGRDMFEECGVEVLPAGGREDGGSANGDEEEDIAAATIGFTTTGVRGAVVLIAAMGAVRTWRSDDILLDHAALYDTVAEFANMLLGQLKRNLFAEGIELQMATPTAFCARRFALPKAWLPHSAWHCLSSAGGRIGMRLDAVFEGPCLFVEEDQGPPPAEAGDMMLF